MAENEIQLTDFKENGKSGPTEEQREMTEAINEEVVTLTSGDIGHTHEESDGEGGNRAIYALVTCRRSCSETLTEHRAILVKVVKIAFFIGACVYLGFAFHHSFGDKQSLTLLGYAVFSVCYYCISRGIHKYGGTLKQQFGGTEKNSRFSRISRLVYWATVGLLLAALVIYVVIDSAIRRPQNLVSLVGVFVFTGIMLLFSTRPDKWLADRVTDYLEHTNRGAQFVFGYSFTDHYVAFKVLPCIIVFSATISILYYLGAMQVAISVVTAVMRFTLDTGPMETLHAAFNIFVGWAETVPVVKPLIDGMTLSELHAVMTNGFATVSGGTLAAYILYGAPANHLISASFMSAPAALSMSKLFYPENSRRKRTQKAPEIKSTERGIIEAASSGAISAIPVIAYILVHLIAFLSILDFVNDTLAWLGARVGVAPPDYPVLSFQYVSSYLMWPIALLMGVEVADCRHVARMLGIKVFVNEFLAFEDLGIMRANNQIFQNYTQTSANATWHWTQTDDIVLDATGQVLPGGAISERSAIIATYALCGFSDLVALGIMIGAFSAVAPSRRRDFLRVAPRALVSGVAACFLTAAMAGLMVD
ncbi:solute carrier family 28 member 3 [Elysia marginata]|uniref:Solute carrier family 28 member 3 n=1 Tax=Elysia marginata TaxID=1093978 RepID=A0AAV4FPT6_9GAST|nr:solute carrier family 28 member 3 [Elysia marginata]